MKLWMITLSLLLSFNVLSLTPSKMGNDFGKVIYGTDDRVDVDESNNYFFTVLARSTAGMTRNYNIVEEDGKTYLLGSKLTDRGICASERFSDQLSAVDCSGFLVGPDILVTAGHCMRYESDCESSSWVFDFTNKPYEANKMEISKSNVYKCQSILAQELSSTSQNDFAVIKLERVVEGRTPLKMRESGKIDDATPLVVIGHPTGLPTKIADGGRVRDNENSVYFQSTLDTFAGNSGSAVLNADTGVVEGILVRGERDYQYDSTMGCQVVNVCDESSCRGEDVTRITNIKYFQ